MSKLIKTNKGIGHLDLSSNKMLPSQTLKIFNSLEKAINILDLDISWNTLPAFNAFKLKPISIFLNVNKNLMHLNISYMNLGVECGSFLLK